ncbi:MAG TPA: hypothetical protein PLB88_09055, partial [Thermoanaerobaculaceae bacterium]|nr:hypothetical protein [Thermoanaerobaculaceae bacterium]
MDQEPLEMIRRHTRRRTGARSAALAALAAAALLAAACAAPLGARRAASISAPPPAGYVASPDQLRPAEVRSHDGMVVCGAPEAARAGAAILAAGG